MFSIFWLWQLSRLILSVALLAYFAFRVLVRMPSGRFDEHLEECTHLRIRRAGLTSVNMPAGAGPSRSSSWNFLSEICFFFATYQ